VKNESTRGAGRGRGRGSHYLQFDKIWKPHRHCLRSSRCGGWAGVRWPIYRANLLVSAVLIQPIPIIIGVGCIKTADTKNTDLWCRPLYDDRHQRHFPYIAHNTPSWNPRTRWISQRCRQPVEICCHATVTVTREPPSPSPLPKHHHHCHHYQSTTRHCHQTLASVRSGCRLLHIVYQCRRHPSCLKLNATPEAWWRTQQQGHPPLPALSSMIDHGQSSLVLKLTGHNNSS
jgi:hypothetical protein